MSPATLLIIEDDADCRRGLDLALRAHGFRVLHAADAHTGVATAAQERPQVIFLDLGLPDGDGLDVIEDLRSRPELDATSIFVVSARDGLAQRARVLEMGAQGYLEKPFHMPEVIELTNDALGSWSSRSPDGVGDAADADAAAGGAAGAGADAADPTHARHREAMTDEGLPSDATLLLVDDDADSLKGLALLFDDLGYETAVAPDALAALSTARRIVPDAIVLDLGLPGCSDTKLLERMRRLDGLESTTIVVVTGKPASEFRDRVLAAGADAFLEKPLDHGALLTALGARLAGEPS